MDSNTHQIYDQNSQPISGLVRLRSAPSSLLANFSGGFEPDGLQIHRFRSSDADLESPNAENFEEKSPATAAYAVTSSQHHNQSYASLPPHYPRPNVAVSSSAMDDGSYQFLTTKPLNSNLARQSSSPAGMFTNLLVQNGGYGSIKNMMSYDSSTRPPSSLGMISQTGNANAAFRSQYDHWNDQSSLMENLPGVKMESQNGEAGNHVQLLSHHLSLPKTSSEMAAMEKIFQMNDSVPFKIRAKRGCATHPRSIAERVRRTKISERMRKLQELVPNMDKQMNTADMLDLAVEYIKALQGQFKMLSDNQANCKCKNTEKKPIQNQMV